MFSPRAAGGINLLLFRIVAPPGRTDQNGVNKPSVLGPRDLVRSQCTVHQASSDLAPSLPNTVI